MNVTLQSDVYDMKMKLKIIFLNVKKNIFQAVPYLLKSMKKIMKIMQANKWKKNSNSLS